MRCLKHLAILDNMNKKDDQSHKKYLADFEADYASSKDQRELANEEMRFCLVKGGQWESEFISGYEDRAKMEFDQVSDYVYRVYAEHCDNRIAVNYSPDDEHTDDEQAELLDGLHRRDIRRKGGQSAIDTAVFEQIICGTGAVILHTEYEDDEDDENNRKNIKFTEQPNAYSTVIWDSSATRADKSDARHCVLLRSFSKARFKELWPDTVDSSLDPQINTKGSFSWVGPDLTYVAERYELEVKNEDVYTYFNPLKNNGKGETVKLDKAENEKESTQLIRNGFQFVRKRRLKKTQVHRVLYNGAGILDPRERVPGKYIPVIPFYGYRSFIDGIENYHGVVRKKIDPQRVLNMLVSLSAEAAATSHQTKHLFAPEQMMNPAVQRQWSGDLSQKAYLLSEPIYNEDGSILHAGPLGTIEGGGMTNSQAAQIQMVSEFLRAGTGGAPQDISDPDASGKAINAIIKRVDMNTAILRDNRKKSMKHLGEVYRSMAAEVYGGRENKGRVVRMVTSRDDTKAVKLLSQSGGDSGSYIANNVASGKFEVLVDVGRDYATQSEETFEQLRDIFSVIGTQSPLSPLVLGRMIQNMPAGGMGDIKEYLRRQELIQGTAKPESEEEVEFLQGLANQPQQPDANSEYLKSEAEKNQATTAKTMQDIRLSAAKTQETIAKAKQTNVETALKAQEAQNKQ